MKGQKTGGRKKGTPNKVTRALREIVEPYSVDAVEKIYNLAMNGENEQVQLAAAREIVDRMWGKAPQTMDMNLGAQDSLKELMREIGERGRTG